MGEGGVKREGKRTGEEWNIPRGRGVGRRQVSDGISRRDGGRVGRRQVRNGISRGGEGLEDNR